ncbi:Uma2 family endonuclease [Synechocystis sp. CS-94]|nr:hypothetical protein D082_07050 [Synechocystis sp. PCC 6714]MCT0253066.1 Uma2 family endonuclease [Synechocystis sp. CS-94]
MIEILPFKESQTKVVKSILFHFNDGTEMGWLINPKEKSIFVYQPSRSPEIFDEMESSFAQTTDLTLGELFGWLIE